MSAWRTDDTSSEKAVVYLPSGKEVRVNDNDSFSETVRKIARDAGISKFNVKVDGEEIEASDAPTDFSGVDEVEIIKYDEGA